MKIAIISDTHDNLANFKKAISLIKKEKIKILIHCGDIFEPETIKEALKDFSRKAHFVLSDVDEDYFKPRSENLTTPPSVRERGNVAKQVKFLLRGKHLEKDYFKDFPNLKIWKKFGEIEISKKTTTHPPPSHSPKASGLLIAFCHSPKTALGLAFSQKYDIVFYGHTHKPWETTPHQSKLGTGQEIRKTKLVNPGNIAGLFFKPTFAIYDIKTNKLKLCIL